jgi:crotonobetainyl-CoA:carnitine CoA-transferase CaiB-like acyl-CoA transferase
MPKIQASIALARFKVIDLSRVRAGPNCVRILTDFGADVVRVEPPEGVDPNEAMFAANRKGGDFQNINRNKRSMTLNLKKEGAMDILKRMIAEADVVVENWRPDVKDRLGLDYESLKAINPRIILASISGFGQDGPYAWRPGFDQIIQGMGGLMSVTGERDDLGGGPQKVGVAVADLMTGMYATVGILAALRHAEKTGEGQQVDMALLDTQVAMLANLGANYLVSGKVPGRVGNAHQNIVPYQVFEVAPNAAGDKDHLILAVGNDSQYAKFCAVAGVPELASNPLFAKNSNRVLNRAQLVPQLEVVMKSRGKADWLAALEAAKVPCGAINNLGEVFADPQVEARAMVTSWLHPLKDSLRLVASPLKLSATPVRSDMPPPLLGQHTEEVLSQLLHYSAAQMADLKTKQVI